MAGPTIFPVPLELHFCALLKRQQTTPLTASNGTRPPVELGSIQTIEGHINNWKSKLRAMTKIQKSLSYQLMIFAQTLDIGVTLSTLKQIRCTIWMLLVAQ